MCYRGSIFEAAIQVNDSQQTGTTEIGRLRKTRNLQQHNQSSVFTLPSGIAHSRREPRRTDVDRFTGFVFGNGRPATIRSVGEL